MCVCVCIYITRVEQLLTSSYGSKYMLMNTFLCVCTHHKCIIQDAVAKALIKLFQSLKKKMAL